MSRKIKKTRHSLGRLKKPQSASGRPSSLSLQGIFRQALALHQAGRLPEAEVRYRQVLSAEPNHPEALHLLGMLAHQAGKSGIGVELIRRALGLRPDYAAAHNTLGAILNQQGKQDEAAGSYRRALDLQPDYAEAHYNLGVVLQAQGKLEEAAASYRRALDLQPDSAAAHNNLGVVLAAQGKQDQAVGSYRRAIGLRPDDAEAHNNLGIAFAEQGELEKAKASFRQALAIRMDYAEAHYNLGNALRDQWQLGKAVASYRRALMLQPDYAEAHYNLGIVLQARGELDDAVASFRRALAEKPDYADAHSHLLFCLNNLPGISQKDIYLESLEWDKRHAGSLPGQASFFSNTREMHRRLRIGYVSGDFREHSVASFIEPVLQAHNRDCVDVHCFANVRKPDARTDRLQALSDHWYAIAAVSDADLAERIRRDEIDILVDLGGHTGEKRLQVFAARPAPIQVTWLGYPNTTGMAAMDYRFTDAIADPDGEADKLHSEELVRLPHGFLCYQPDPTVPEVEPLPCEQHGFVTFGSFNNLAKVNREVVKAWGEIIRKLPRSRLILKAKSLADPDTREKIQRLFAAQGVSEDRLELHGWLPSRNEHLALYSRIDVGLDPFPYNGTTTTCEALWMGVPVVTLRGARHAARVGASIMHHIGLEELVASSENAYEQLAVSLAQDRHRLRILRSGLRQRMQESPLLDKVRFAASLEEAYRSMWRKWCGREMAEGSISPGGSL